jgi:Ca2+/Na+ antiporter
MLGTAIFISIYLLRGYTIGRRSGIVMLVAYVGYTYWLYAEAAMAQVL